MKPAVKLMSLALPLTLTSFLMIGCASSYQLTAPADRAPAAQAELKVKEAKHGNKELELNVNHLAPAERVEPGAKSYVVWIKPEGSEHSQNIGALGLNKNLSARFRTIIAYDNFDFFVTAEENSATIEPEGPRIFEKTIQ